MVGALRIVRARTRDRRLAESDAAEAAERFADNALENSWDDEWRRHVLNMALAELKGRIQPENYLAFEMYALQNRPVQEVAEFLNLSAAAVYTNKSRCIAMLREIAENFREE